MRQSDIAKVLNVSTTTVSLGLRDSSRVSLALRKKIKITAETMGYRPNAMAVALAEQRKAGASLHVSAGLAWINRWEDPLKLRSYKEFDLYWRGASETAERLGFRVEEFVVDDKMTAKRLDDVLACRGIEGVFVPPHPRGSGIARLLGKMDWSQRAVIKFGYSIGGFAANIVTANHVQGASLAVSNILDKGYRKIGYVCASITHTQMIAGALMEKVEFVNEFSLPVLKLPPDQVGDEELRLLDGWIRENQPDAILSELVGTREMLEKLGYRVPEDVALAAVSVLDGNANAGLLQNSYEIGKAAAKTLISQVYHHDFGVPDNIIETLVSGSWQDGDSLPEV